MKKFEDFLYIVLAVCDIICIIFLTISLMGVDVIL